MAKLISRYCQQYRVQVDDYRLAFGTPEQRAETLRQIAVRSEASKRGWAKRKLTALAPPAHQGE